MYSIMSLVALILAFLLLVYVAITMLYPEKF